MRFIPTKYLKLCLIVFLSQSLTAEAQTLSGPSTQNSYPKEEVIDTGQKVFGKASNGLAAVVENAISKYGEPNAYVIGSESSVAFFAGIQYGEGELHTRGTSPQKIYWQGPTVGVDVGLSGNRVMMLVYNLPSKDKILDRFVGINGSAYVAGGLGMTVLSNENIYVIPVRVGLGIRMGINTGYIKFTENAAWNPF